MIPGIDPKVDYAFKRLFGMEKNLPLLLHLLHAILQLPPNQRIVALELLNPFSDKEALDDKLAILDIKARDQQGRLFNVEMQMLAYGPFRQRSLYYWAKLYQGQLQEGMDYRAMRPTISVCLVNTPLFPEIPDYHLTFELRERRHQVAFTDDLAVHILELSKFTRSAAELASPLDVWLYFLKHAETLDTDKLPAALDVPEVRRALGELAMLTQSELERERYEARLKLQRDIYTSTAVARDEGLAEGLAKGEVKRVHFCQRLLQRALTPTEQLLQLSLDELSRLAEQLEAEVSQSLSHSS
jgi:predicted transposase/invertase (TIGR01784 family)